MKITMVLAVLMLAGTASFAFIKTFQSKKLFIHFSTKNNNDAPKPTATFLDISLGEGYKDINVKFLPVFEQSTIFSVTYEVPFGLNIDKPPKGFPCPMVTKDGTQGEKKGDILRATTCWSQGF